MGRNRKDRFRASASAAQNGSTGWKAVRQLSGGYVGKLPFRSRLLQNHEAPTDIGATQHVLALNAMDQAQARRRC